MSNNIFGRHSEDMDEDIHTDKRRLEEKELERAHQARKDKVNFTFSWVAIIVRGIVGTFISVFVFTQANRIEDEDTLSRFNLLVDHNINSIEQNLHFLTQEIHQVGAFLLMYPQTTNAQFLQFIEPILQENNSLSDIAWHPLPLQESEFSPSTWNSAQQAIKSKEITTDNTPLHSTKDVKNKAILNVFVPILDTQSGNPTGVISAKIDIGTLFQESLHIESINSIDIYIYEKSLDGTPSLLYFYNATPSDKKDLSVMPEDFKDSLFSTQRTLFVGDPPLTVIYEATPEFTAHTWQATIAAGIGVFITSFIVVTAWILLEIEKRQFSNVLHEEHIQEIEGTIDLLETTKNRMVAQENLASLGGLTAGIAHEIKNPLNFINNFSSLSLELIVDVETFLNKYNKIGSPEERNNIYESMQNLKENIKTINEQGERANSTIQRMLAHSRGKPGEWGVTDIHKMLEEYINFSYHGMRAKNSNFNVKIEREFNATLKDIQCVGNDMSRVFLNLLNNAFQSVEEKQKKLGGTYHPLVTIKTQIVGNYLRIRIRDNGIGISDENKANIFTPFFTTKPTGVGTGLGLSLSYNIIVREHRGSLTFDSKENEFCEFIITIPLHPQKVNEVVTQ